MNRPLDAFTPVSLDAVLTTDELARRLSRPPDHAAEAQALAALARAMTASPDSILQTLVETALALCRADSAGISILEPGAGVFRWRATAGSYAPNLRGGMARDASPCGTVIDRNATLLFAYPERHFQYPVVVDPPIVEALLVPFHAGGKPVGTVWIIAHTPERRFDAEDARLLTSLSLFAAAAHQMVTAFEAANVAPDSERRTNSPALPTLSDLWELVTRRMGVCPSFFKLAQHDPSLAWGLFRLAEFAYLDSPMPPLFKEVLFTYLSRFCEVRYCVARHCAFLLGRGFVAGDPDCPPLTSNQAVALLEEPLPAEGELPGWLRELEDAPAPLADWPDPSSAFGRTFRVACAVVFIDPHRKGPWLRALKRLLEPERHDRLMLFLAFIRTAHYWTEVHPELTVEPDIEEMFHQHEGLGRLLLHEADSPRWKLREALRASEERLRRAMSIGTVGVLFFNLDERITDANVTFERMTGYSREDLLGTVQREVLTPQEYREATSRAAEELAERGQTAPYEKEMIRKDGSRWWGLFAPTRLAGSGLDSQCVEFVIDISERKAMEDALREADRKKDDFIALLAHELRNPLAPIRNGLQVMRLSEDRGIWERSQQIMDRQLVHLIRLVDDLLDVSRIGRNKMELRRSRVRLAEVMHSAIETARPVIDAAGHHLEVALPLEPVILDADLTRLAQVFSNLLTNSAKYTKPGGKIWFSAELRGEGVEVSVRDTGIGIPPESLGKIFDMFSQVDRSIERSTGGLGIGLALVRGLVEMHGGTVTVASGGEGSTFTVFLPCLSDEPEPAVTSNAGRAAPVSKRRILIVDDNRDGAESLAEMLLLFGHEVHTAHDGLEAVEVAGRFRPEVILMDVGMPKLNGLDATRRIRETEWGKVVTVIALTGWGQEDDRERSREAGCDGHLVKPVTLADLEKLLASGLEKCGNHQDG